MSMQNDVILVVSNAPDLLVAKRIAHELLEAGLAACVNLGPPMLSMYRWQGVIEGAEEVPLLIKTTRAQEAALLEMLVTLHPYEVPEAVVVPVEGGLPAYLEWVRAETGTPLH
ncbi:divalent-cation tolerance protein CutA [Achromobacter sp. GG226]|uniref:divalent-cation tolerance protein CutA n=1 Tax=Verticiella alkaliphila TaxID=2779529 RepID=UPI001C0E3367|nr:divalent-cation tolerance protein CutA [Verticiella sp. GG226]MBU4611619.1 divalent-cation tolerance protein CutA [Verticiella sp. GG226]